MQKLVYDQAKELLSELTNLIDEGFEVPEIEKLIRELEIKGDGNFRTYAKALRRAYLKKNKEGIHVQLTKLGSAIEWLNNNEE